MAAPRPATTPPPRRTWQRRSDARPREIRAAALRLFAERGYGGATVEDIAREAGVTVGTVYRYFTDKDSLLVSLVDWVAEEPLLPAPAPGPDPETRIRETLAAVWTASRRPPHGELLRLLAATTGATPALVARYRKLVLEPVERAVADLIGGDSAEAALTRARAVVGCLLGASLLGGGEPLVPQLAPREVTLELLVRAAIGSAAPAAPGGSRPGPRFGGPEAW